MSHGEGHEPLTFLIKFIQNLDHGHYSETDFVWLNFKNIIVSLKANTTNLRLLVLNILHLSLL